MASGDVASLGVDLDAIYDSLLRYLDLLLKWNERTNLTAIRSPEQIVIRHFGESLFAARCAALVLSEGNVLDFGSGAGFPGIPLQLYSPHLKVTLAESQGKKAAFLRTAVRELGLKASVLGERVSSLPASSSFDLLTMRAVDDPEKARAEAWGRVRGGGWLLEMTTSGQPGNTGSHSRWTIPNTRDGLVVLTQKL